MSPWRKPITSPLVLAAALGACAPHGANPPGFSGAAPRLLGAFPHVRIDAANRVVEFDARVSPMLAPDPRAPRFYLEVLCCSPQTREHETLFVTQARPSDVHAALLAIGLRPGSPGGFRREGTGVEPEHPTGDRIDVGFVQADAGSGPERDPLDCVVNARDGSRFLDEERRWAAGGPGRPSAGWVFAGSRVSQRAGIETYDADGTGVVFGLTTFGSEVIGWSRTISPDSAVQTPEWIADFARTPPAGSRVRIRVHPAR